MARTKKQTKTEVLQSLVDEGFGTDIADVEVQLADMGISWQDVRDGRWY